MNPNFQTLIHDATRLTRAGDLKAATAAIRSALSGSNSDGPAPHEPQGGPFIGGKSADVVIDVDARHVPDIAPDQSQSGTPTENDTKQPPASAHQGGDRFIAGTFETRSGTRHYKLYIPP